LLLCGGAAQFAIGLVLAQAMNPRFNIAHDFLGDLGIGPTALLFNGSIAVFGGMLLAAAMFLFRSIRRRTLGVVVALTGIGALGFGLIPATDRYELVHTGAAFLAFIFGALSAIVASRVLHPPLRYVSAGLGVVSLSALALLSVWTWVSVLDRGWTEQLIVWPILLWGMAAGASFLLRRTRVHRRVMPAGPGSA
jgi:hypothetical membrane protein